MDAKKSYLQQALLPEDKLVDYSKYRFSISELILSILLGGILAWAIGYFFYDSLLVSVVMLAGFPFFLKYMRGVYGEKRRDELKLQFRDAVSAVSANQKAGYSIENAFREAYNDCRLLYGSKSMICRELNHIRKGLDNNLILEQMILSLGERSGIDDIYQFGEVFAIAKRSGGNITEMIDMTASVIDQKIDVEQEIAVMVSSRKMEANLMSCVPFFMIFYMSVTSQGFFDCLYHNIVGVAIMSVCLVVYIAAYLISRRLVNIRI